MKNLIDLHLKQLDADHKVCLAMQNDWPASTRAFKAAATRAAQKYCAAVEAYLVQHGVEPTIENKIRLMHRVQGTEHCLDVT